MSYEIRTAPAPFVVWCLVRLALARGTDVARNLKMARYRVHEAGEFEADGSQRCRRCGELLVDYAPERASRGARARRRGESWGFPVGRRVIVGPTCTFLVTADRALAPDEESCS